jgi:catechol 2,3-dioxygenase-like lactoylglutathione lyase family enzyme
MRSPWRAAVLGMLIVVLSPLAILNYAQQDKTKSTTVELKNLDHVGINVSNLQRSADWYERVLGFKVIRRWNTTWMSCRVSMRIGLFLRTNATKINDLDNKLAITHFAFLTSASGFEEGQTELKTLGVKFDRPEDTGIAD